MKNENLTLLAHDWARHHRNEYPSYRTAYAEGYRIVRIRNLAVRGRELERQALQAKIDARQQHTPLLLKDWKHPDYPGKRDFREAIGGGSCNEKKKENATNIA